MNAISKVSILIDNDSWILSQVEGLISALESRRVTTSLVRHQEDVPEGDICFLLGCTELVKPHILHRNRHNLVVHESALPAGRGFAPMTWQILEGNNEIPICLFEAATRPDSGSIWIQDIIHLDGYELCDDLRRKQGLKTVEMCLRFVDEYSFIQPREQSGDSSFYPRRTPEDSQLDNSKSIRDQFDLL